MSFTRQEKDAFDDNNNINRFLPDQKKMRTKDSTSQVWSHGAVNEAEYLPICKNSDIKH